MHASRLVAAAGLVVALSAAAVAGEKKSLPIGTVAPAIKTGSWVNAGKGLGDADLKGRVVLLEFFEPG